MSNIIVSTIADLKALSLTGIVEGDVVHVGGYHVVSDGGGGHFVWHKFDQSHEEDEPPPPPPPADDGGMVIAPTIGGSSRWLRLAKANRMRVAWYGAEVGTETDQTLLIQKAINKAADAGGGVVEFESGVYFIHDVITVGDNITLVGQGRRTTILKQQPYLENTSIIELGHPNYIHLPAPRPVRRKITISNIGFNLVNNKSAKAIKLLYEVDDIKIVDCECWQSKIEDGEASAGEGDRHFVDMSVSGPFGVTLPGAVGIQNLKIIRCSVSSMVQLCSNAGRGVSNLLVDGCLIENPIAYGLAITSVAWNVSFSIENIVITNNIFRNVDSGILIGRDQTSDDQVIQLYQRIHQARNITIANNLIVLGATYANPSIIATAISISTYQSHCCRIKIHGNTICRREGLLPEDTKGIQIVSFDYNWLSALMAGVAPTIASVDTTLNTITTSKPARLYSEMAVRFERTNPSDVLPSPLQENRRYRIINENPFDTVVEEEHPEHVITPDTNSVYKLIDYRTGNPIDLTAAGSGAVKVIYSPCVEDITISDNTISGMSEGIYLTDCFSARIINNMVRRGNMRSTPSGLLEEVEFSGNKVSMGTYQLNGRVTNGVIAGELFRVRDDEFGLPNLAAFNFNPVQNFTAQSWRIDKNVVELTRVNESIGWHVVSAFRVSGAGQVKINSLKGNGVSPFIPRAFDDLAGAMIQGASDNYILPEETAPFVPTSVDTFARIIADVKGNNGLREAQTDIGLTGREPLDGGVFFEGTPGYQQASTALIGVKIVTDGRGLTWRHRVNPSNATGGLWALTSSSSAGHAANALYAFEQNGLITIRQIGATPGTLTSTGAVSLGDYRQVTFDASSRRGLTAQFTVSIDKFGVISVWMDGMVVKLSEGGGGTRPAWNNTLPSDLVLNVAYVDASGSFPGFNGSFYSLSLLNFAPTDAHAQALFAGGVNALPGYGLRNPSNNISDSAFADPSNNWSVLADAGITFASGKCNFANVAANSWLSQILTQYRKSQLYRLQIDIDSYTSGQLYVTIGAAIFRPAWTPSIGVNVFEGEIQNSDNSFRIRAAVNNTSLVIKNVSMVPLGAVASYTFDVGLGYQIEDKAGLSNHLTLAEIGGRHLQPLLERFWTARIAASGYLIRNGRMMEDKHLITRIMAYSRNGATITLGESAALPASLMSSTSLTAGVWKDLADLLLKSNTPTNRIYCALVSGTEVQIVIEYSVPRLIN